MPRFHGGLVIQGLRAEMALAVRRSETAGGERQDLRKLVYRVMDGEEIDLKSLSKEEADYIKTTRVLMGKSLYSDSWLEL